MIMSKWGSICLVITSLALIVLVAGHVQAWEFKMTGSFNYIYEYYGQLGNQGFFGPYNVDRSRVVSTIYNRHQTQSGTLLQTLSFPLQLQVQAQCLRRL